MNQFVVQLVTAAAVGAFSPVATMATIAVLTSRRHALRNALGLLLGWSVLLVALAALLLLLFAGTGAALSDSTKALLNVIIGVLLLSFGLRNLIGDRHPLTSVASPHTAARSETPHWMRALDTLTFVKSIGVGAVLLAVSPADLGVFLSALQGLAGHDSGPRLALTAALVVAIDLCILLPTLIDVLMPRRAGRILAALREYLTLHQRTLMSIVCGVFGVLLLVSGTLRLG